MKVGSGLILYGGDVSRLGGGSKKFCFGVAISDPNNDTAYNCGGSPIAILGGSYEAGI